MAGVRGDGSTLAFEPASLLSLTTPNGSSSNTNGSSSNDSKKPSLSFSLGKAKVAAKKVNVSQDGRADDPNSNRMAVDSLSAGALEQLQRVEVKKQIVIPMIKNNWRGLEQVKADAIAAAAKLAQVSATGDPNDIKDAVKKALEEGRVKKEKTENDRENGNGDVKPMIKTEDQLAAEALLAEAKAIEDQGSYRY